MLALVLCLGLLPTSVLADAPTDYPFVPSIGTVTGCIVNGYDYDSDWNGTPDATVPLYTVCGAGKSRTGFPRAAVSKFLSRSR